MNALQEHLKRWLLLYVLLAMAIGLALGYPKGAWIKAHQHLLSHLMKLAVFFIIVTWVDHRLGLSYRDHMAVVFASTGKNNGTAIAIATTTFSPLVAIPAATMPISQALLLVFYLKMAGWVRGYFDQWHPVR